MDISNINTERIKEDIKWNTGREGTYSELIVLIDAKVEMIKCLAKGKCIISLDNKVIKEILFEQGWPSVKYGDNVRAYVQQADLIRERDEPPKFARRDYCPKLSLYEKRPFKKSEIAVRIDLLNGKRVIGIYGEYNGSAKIMIRDSKD